MAVQKIANSSINGLAFKVSSVHIDCYYLTNYIYVDMQMQPVLGMLLSARTYIPSDGGDLHCY